MKIIDFETSKLACLWILGVLIVFQFFPIFANIFLKIQGNKDHIRTTSTQNLTQIKDH